jgi:hypothetical protein
MIFRSFVFYNLLFLTYLSGFPLMAHTREENINRIFEASGLTDTLKDHNEINLEQSLKNNIIVLESILDSVNFGNSMEKKCLIQVVSPLIKESLRNIDVSAEETVSIFKKYYGEGLTNDEIQKVADYETSSLARRSAESQNIALLKVQQEINQLGETRLRKQEQFLIKAIESVSPDEMKSCKEKF